MFMGLEDVDHTTFFTLSQSGLHGHPYQLFKRSLSLNKILESSFFPVRLLDVYSSLVACMLQCTLCRHLNDT